MDNLGAIGGPLLALALVAAVGIRTTIVLSVIPGLLAAGAIVIAIRSAPKIEQRERRPLRIRVRPVLQGPLGRLFYGIGAFELGNAAATLLILRATDQLDASHWHDTAVQLGLAPLRRLQPRGRAHQPARRRPARPPRKPARARARRHLLPRRLRRVRRRRRARSHSWRCSSCSPGTGKGLVETAEQAAVAVHAPEEIRGSAFGLLAAVQSFGNLGASAVAGALWTLVSPRVAFAYLAAWMVVSLAALGSPGKRSGWIEADRAGVLPEGESSPSAD